MRIEKSFQTVCWFNAVYYRLCYTKEKFGKCRSIFALRGFQKQKVKDRPGWKSAHS